MLSLVPLIVHTQNDTVSKSILEENAQMVHSTKELSKYSLTMESLSSLPTNINLNTSLSPSVTTITSELSVVHSQSMNVSTDIDSLPISQSVDIANQSLSDTCIPEMTHIPTQLPNTRKENATYDLSNANHTGREIALGTAEGGCVSELHENKSQSENVSMTYNRTSDDISSLIEKESEQSTNYHNGLRGLQINTTHPIWTMIKNKGPRGSGNRDNQRDNRGDEMDSDDNDSDYQSLNYNESHPSIGSTIFSSVSDESDEDENKTPVKWKEVLEAGPNSELFHVQRWRVWQKATGNADIRSENEPKIDIGTDYMNLYLSELSKKKNKGEYIDETENYIAEMAMFTLRKDCYHWHITQEFLRHLCVYNGKHELLKKMTIKVCIYNMCALKHIQQQYGLSHL